MIRAPSSVSLYLIRHAEALKNLEGIHGGGDQRLTPNGVEQAHRLAHFLLQRVGFTSELSTITHQPEGRSEQTARIIGGFTLSRICLVPELEGVGMGIIGGLPPQVLAKQYTEIANGMELWRASKGAIPRPKVPGAEPMINFADRVLRGLKLSIDSTGQSHSIAIVATTSTLVMLKHLLRNDGMFDRPSYEFGEVPLGSLSEWRITNEEPPAESMSTVIPE